MTAGESFSQQDARSTWSWVTAVYVGLTILYAWPLLGVMASALPHDTGDPGLNTWILWWNAQAWPLTDRWWNAPIFHPAPGTFALSETFLSVVPLTTPLQWLGVSAVTTYNIVFLLSFPLTGLAGHALARRLTGRHDVAFIAGIALAFCPWRTAQMPHLQMLLMWWMPLMLLALHRYLDQRRTRDLVIAGIAWLMNGLTSGYFLVFFGVLVGFWAVWFVRARRDWIAIAATLLIATLPMAPLLIRYKQIQSGYGLFRGPEEVSAFSADLTAVWATPADVVSHFWTKEPRAEGELYPGLTIFVLAAIGAWTAWRAHRSSRWPRLRKILLITGVVFGVAILALSSRGGWRTSILGIEISLNRPAKAMFAGALLVAVSLLWDRRLVDVWRRRSTFFFYGTGAVLMLLFALGPTGRAFGWSFFYQAPYWWLMHLPGGDALRVPARFGILFAFCLGQAAALALARLTPRGAPHALVAALAAAVYLEGWVPHFPVKDVPPSFELEQMRPEIPLLELPIVDGFSETAAMLRATRHKHVLVNGASGYSPPHYDTMIAGLQAPDTSIIAALQTYGPLLVYVNHAQDEAYRYRDALDRLQPAVIGRSAAGTLYELPGRPPAPQAAADSELPIAAIAASVKNEEAPAMRDGQLTSRWESAGPQSPGDQVILTLDRVATVSRLEFDLGEFRSDYPRKLRVSVSSGAGGATTVWEGSTAGMAVAALIKDRVRVPIAIAFPPGTQATQITLTVVEGHSDYWWSIAEVRVYGR